MPLEHFRDEEQMALLPPPTSRYDVPLWCEPKVARDQHAQVALALYSLPTRFVGKTLRARADRDTVRFYDGGALVKVHPRKPPRARSTDISDFPPEKAAYAQRDVAFLQRSAGEHGAAVGRLAQVILGGPLPWTRMRQVYALLGLCKRYGDARVDEACAIAADAGMTDVRRLQRMLLQGTTPISDPTPTRPVPVARYLRPSTQYALPFHRATTPPTQGETHERSKSDLT
jgi:hypothetical protein